MGKLRLGYVGGGFMAQKVHLPNFASLPDVDLLALAEVREELGRKVQDRFGIPRLYRDHHELAADPDIDAVAVSAHFALQGDIARDCLLAGKDVFMEKPMAVSVEQGEKVLQAERESGKRLMIGHMKRYDAGNELFKATLDGFRESGEIGPITFARNHGFCGDWICGLDTPMDSTEEPYPPAPTVKPDWLPKEYLNSYLGYLQQYCHNVNLLRWFLNAGDDVTVKAVDLDKDGYTGVVLFEMNGVRASLESGSISHYRWDEHTQVYGKHGWLLTTAPPLLLKNVPAEVEVYRAGETQQVTRPIPKDRWSWSYKRQAEYFVRAVQSGEPFRTSAEDTLTDVRIFEEIYRIWLKQQGAL
ncbi:MAG: Gfo/Idh/MocA family oxidoreductase [Armatimonadetes bacterium]|nr:Gfo/Idh/MocA family oxidoreductase [Armatimonadota bacterium]